MRLTDLDAYFLRLGDLKGAKFSRQKEMAGAQGVMFQCPKCSADKEKSPDGGYIGAHYVICWFRGVGVPDAVTPLGRWNPSGTSLDDLTFVGPENRSVWITTECKWHGFVSLGGAE